MWFDSFRLEGFPTRYADRHASASIDILTAGLLATLLIIGFCFLLILPAYRGWDSKVKLVIKLFCALFISGGILLGNYGEQWEAGHVNITSQYKAASSEEVQGILGLYVALRGVNITLQGNAKNKTGELMHEVINYNEHYSWEWAQGRFGFGPYAGRFSREYRSSVLRGDPWPILQVAEYFTFDGEMLRFGRYYRWAGWYAQLFMWTAFATWLISVLLFNMTVRGGSFLLFITGSLQLAAIIVWTGLRNPIEIKIPFESEDGTKEVFLKTHFGRDYYVVLFNSISCILMGGAIFVLDLFYGEQLCEFFNINPQTLYEDYLSSGDELVSSEMNNEIEMNTIDIERYRGLPQPDNILPEYTYVARRRKSTFRRRDALQRNKPRKIKSYTTDYKSRVIPAA